MYSEKYLFLAYAKISIAVIDNPQELLLPSFLTHVQKKTVPLINVPQGFDVQHREVYSTLFSNLYGKRINKNTKACMYMSWIYTESVHCRLQTRTKLQTN